MKIYILRTLELLDVLPFSTLFGVYGILLYIWIALFYPAYLAYQLVSRVKKTVKKGKKPLTRRERFTNWLNKKVNTIVVILYGETNEKLTSFLERERDFGSRETTDVWKETQLFWVGLMIRVNALTLLLLSALVLRDRFLIQRSIECDDEKICFLGTNDPINGWDRTPITNCSNVTDPRRVVCFEFSYSVGDAVGLAGGLISYGVYIMKFGSIAMISIFTRLQKCCSRTAYRMTSLAVQQVPILLVLAVAVISLAFVRFRDLIFYGSFVEAFGIASVLALVITTPWSVLVEETKSKLCIEKIETAESSEKTKSRHDKGLNGRLEDSDEQKFEVDYSTAKGECKRAINEDGVEIVMSETESLD